MEPLSPRSESGSSGHDFSTASDISSDEDAILFGADEDHDAPLWARPHPAQFMLERRSAQHALVSNDSLNDGRVYGNDPVLGASRISHDPLLRLLRISPGADSEPIISDIIIRPVFDAPPYTALSYSWGAEAPSEEISIGDYTFRVTPHLLGALCSLRDGQHFIDVWVDAVCINQANALDKAAQVQNMAQIYNQAQQVRVWLGNIQVPRFANDLERFATLSRIPDPWWERLWVIQECAYAQFCPIVMFGSESMSLEEFVSRLTATIACLGTGAQRAWEASLTTMLSLLHAPFDAWQMSSQHNVQRIPLLERLCQTRGRKFAEPHDRIYALLNLVERKEIQQVQPDYGKPLPELWRHIKGMLVDFNHGLLEDYDWLSTETELYTTSNAKAIAFPLDDSLVQALLSAHESGDLDLVDLCLRINMSTGDGICEHAVLSCVAGDYSDRLQSLLAAGVPPHRRYGPGMKKAYLTALMIAAAYCGFRGTVAALLDNGADVNEVGHFGSALEAASYQGYRKVVALLLDRGAEVNAEGINSTALCAAAAAGNADVLRQLLSAGADIDSAVGRHSHAARLQQASRLVSQHQPYHRNRRRLFHRDRSTSPRKSRVPTSVIESIANLTDNEVVSEELSSCTTALEYAVYHQHRECIRVLRNFDAKKSASVMRIASSTGNHRVLEALLR